MKYVLSTGCQWRYIPKDLPPRSTVNGYFCLWGWNGTLEKMQAPRLGPREARNGFSWPRGIENIQTAFPPAGQNVVCLSRLWEKSVA